MAMQKMYQNVKRCGQCLRFIDYRAENFTLGKCPLKGNNVSMLDVACDGYVDQDILEVFQRLFVARADCYAKQTEDGYVKVDSPLTADVLTKHFQGKTTVGAYQINVLNGVKYLAFDLDPEKLENPKETAERLLTECVKKPSEKEPRFYSKNILFESSRYDDPSFHIWIFFQPVPVPAQMARWLGMKILEHASISPKQVEVFPKQNMISEGGFGNFLKLPLGLHQKAQKWSWFLNSETFEPLQPTCLLDAQGITFSEADLKRIEEFKKKTHIQVALSQSPNKIRFLKSREEERIANFLVKYWRPGVRNQFELYFLGWAMKKGIAYESVLRIIDAVTTLTQDEEKQARLDLVRYHFETRGFMLPELKGISGIREIVREALKK